MLGAGVNQPLVLLLRQRVGHLALKVEVLLTADLQRATQGVRGAGQGLRGISPADKHRWQHITLCRQRILDRQNGRQRFNTEFDQPGCGAGLHYAGGHHQTDDLAHVLHRVDGKNGLVMGKGRQHRVANNVTRKNHITHAAQGQGGAGVHRN